MNFHTDGLSQPQICTPTDAATEIVMPHSSSRVVLTALISDMSHVCLCCYIFPTGKGVGFFLLFFSLLKNMKADISNQLMRVFLSVQTLGGENLCQPQQEHIICEAWCTNSQMPLLVPMVLVMEIVVFEFCLYVA